jgi:hypothetical protein
MKTIVIPEITICVFLFIIKILVYHDLEWDLAVCLSNSKHLLSGNAERITTSCKELNDVRNVEWTWDR